jgi:murein DD-endopeptidase MepM/ murein hydrolase activator NlpD
MIENKRWWVGFGIIIIIGISIYILPKNRSKTEAETAQILVADVVVVTPPEPNKLYGIVIDSMQVTEGRVKRNQFLSQILSAHNVPYQKIHALSVASKSVFDVRKIAAHKKYTVISYLDSIKTPKAFIYEPNLTEYVVFNLEDSVTVEHITKEVITKDREVAGIIEASLAVTIDELDISPQLTNDFVDVFAWQVDFFRLQKGDRFKVIYEEKLVDEQPVGIGRIKGIYFEHFSNGYYAFHYDQGSGVDYFDEEGNSLRKALLKYPLEFTRISSRYSGNRFHPVQKRWKAHRGTDFAAPKGTPIRAVGDGIVVEAKYGKYNGRYVKIRHNSTYTTQYLHMSRIASSMKPGQKVKQGQTIGYVGSTGLAKGNHLCYRFWKNGVQIDALRVDLPPSEPIEASHYNDFEIARNEIMNRLDVISFPEEQDVLQASF